LLCADAAVRQSAYGEVIPSSPILVVDEAHQLEDVATQYFGVGVSNFRVDDLVRDAERLFASVADVEDLHRALTRVSDHARSFFGAIAFGRSARAESRLRYTAEAIGEYVEEGAMLAGALEGLEATFALVAIGNGSSPPGQSQDLPPD